MDLTHNSATSTAPVLPAAARPIANSACGGSMPRAAAQFGSCFATASMSSHDIDPNAVAQFARWLQRCSDASRFPGRAESNNHRFPRQRRGRVDERRVALRARLAHFEAMLRAAWEVLRPAEYSRAAGIDHRIEDKSPDRQGFRLPTGSDRSSRRRCQRSCTAELGAR